MEDRFYFWREISKSIEGKITLEELFNEYYEAANRELERQLQENFEKLIDLKQLREELENGNENK